MALHNDLKSTFFVNDTFIMQKSARRDNVIVKLGAFHSWSEIHQLENCYLSCTFSMKNSTRIENCDSRAW